MKRGSGLWYDPDLQLALNWREQSKPNQTWARRYHQTSMARWRFWTRAAQREKKRRLKGSANASGASPHRLVALRSSRRFIISLASAVMPSVNRKRHPGRSSSPSSNRWRRLARERGPRKRQRRAERESTEALKQKGIADQQTEDAKEARQVALAQKELAEKAKLQALAQARIASENERKAEAAELRAVADRQRAESQRARAEAEEEENAHLLYVANISLAQKAYEDAETIRARELLSPLWEEERDKLGFEWYYLWRRYHNDLVTFQGHDEGGTSWRSPQPARSSRPRAPTTPPVSGHRYGKATGDALRP